MENLKGSINLGIYVNEKLDITQHQVTQEKQKHKLFGKKIKEPINEVILYFEDGRDLKVAIKGFHSVVLPKKNAFSIPEILKLDFNSSLEVVPSYFIFDEELKGCTIGMVRGALDKEYDISDFYEGKRNISVNNYLSIIPNSIQLSYNENYPHLATITADCECDLNRIIEDYHLEPLEQGIELERE